MTNLLISVLGNRNSGKSLTWNTLFGGTVRTGRNLRELSLSEIECVDVFLVSGSPEEREEYVGDLITTETPRIVLCSMQYKDTVETTIDYFLENDYSLYVHWLNPGYNDAGEQEDHLHLTEYLLHHARAMVAVRNGTVDPADRVEEIRDYIRGWAHGRGLIRILT